MHTPLGSISLAAVAAAAVIGGSTRTAAAQHDHGSHGGHGSHQGHGHGAHGGDGDGDDASGGGGGGGGGSSFAAALGMIAAGYDSMLYTGDYQGLVATGRWARGRYAAAVSMAAYRIERNGKAIEGIGDLMVHGHATLLAAGRIAAGAVAMVMVPTGDHEAGLGMGHVMLMPGAWVSASLGRVTLGASAGYSRALGDASIHADHGGSGAWPLVDPMNTSELTFGASAMVSLAGSLRAGVRADGAAPIGDGVARLTSGVRAVWTLGRVETTAELQAGLAGDPFDVRGLVEAAVRFGGP